MSDDYPGRYFGELAASFARSTARRSSSTEVLELIKQFSGPRGGLLEAIMYARLNPDETCTSGERGNAPGCPEVTRSQGYPSYLGVFPKDACTCGGVKVGATRTGTWTTLLVKPSLGLMHANGIKRGTQATYSVTSCLRPECLRKSIDAWEKTVRKESKSSYLERKLVKGVGRVAARVYDDEFIGSVYLPFTNNKDENGITAHAVFLRWQIDPERRGRRDPPTDQYDYRPPLLPSNQDIRFTSIQQIQSLYDRAASLGLLLSSLHPNVRRKGVDALSLSNADCRILVR